MKKILVILLLSLFLSQSAKSQEKDKNRYELDTTHNKWNVRVGPYFWLLGVKGTLTKPPTPSNLPELEDNSIDIDWDFYDVLNSLKFAAMVLSEYHTEDWIFKFNFSSLILESDVLTPKEIILKNTTLRYTYVGTDIVAGYRFVHNKSYELDVSIGGKVAYFKVDVNSNVIAIEPIDFHKEHLLIDPVIAVRYLYRPITRVELSVYADYGSEILDDTFSYQLNIGGKYVFSKHFSSGITYRTIHYDTNIKDAVFSGSIYGPTINFVAQF